MKSMTGFGRSEKETPLGKVVVEIQSVNRKYFELNISLPKEFTRFENDLRKKVSEQVQRGLVSIRVYVFPNATAFENLLPDIHLLKSLQDGWEKIAAELGFEKKTVDLAFLVDNFSEMPHVKLASDEDMEPILVCLDSALNALDAMRSVEGKMLAKDIGSRLTLMEKKLAEIEQMAPEAVSKLRLKLKERMEEIFSRSEELDERLLREVALFAERVDISEEITRFRSHLAQYRDHLKEHMGPAGRKMDFLTQEMGREINTIGSKSMDSRISHFVVDVKAELEKVREQIQNIE
jgi:uncharacterized protein (TIGR00255 family)